MGGALVFDVGLHQGEDTAYYLHRGMRVVAVDADPALIAAASVRHADAVRDGRLRLVHCAVASEDAPVSFHVSANSEWSSLNTSISTRRDMAQTTITVAGRRLSSLFAEFGVPAYAKIDIEGADIIALKSLHGSSDLPAYISVESECAGDNRLSEEEALATVDELQHLGYAEFKLIEQQTLMPLPPQSRFYRPQHLYNIRKRFGLLKDYRLELSRRSGWSFPGSASGPWGEELGGTWIDATTARGMLLRHRRDYFAQPTATAFGFWCDWHARLRPGARSK